MVYEMRNPPQPTVRLTKKGSHSEAWTFFGFGQDDESQNHVHCRQFFATVAEHQGNTTNLYNHLKHHLKLQYDVALKATKKSAENPCHPTTQASIMGTLYGASPYPSNSRRQTLITWPKI